MEQILLLIKHMVSYLTCAVFLVQLSACLEKRAATVLELIVISLFGALLTAAAGKFFSVPFVSILGMILVGLYFHLRKRGKLLTLILLSLDVYALSLFLNLVLSLLSYSAVRFLLHSENTALVAICNLIFYLLAAGLLFCLFIRKRRPGRELEGPMFYSISLLCVLILLCILAVVLPGYLVKTHTEWFFLLAALIIVAAVLTSIFENNAQKKRITKLSEEVRSLTSQIHHSKEYLPAISRRIEEELAWAKNQGNELELAKELTPLKEEVDGLLSEQFEQSRREFLHAMAPDKTGMLFLDELLSDFHRKMELENILFSVHVYNSPAVLIQKGRISQGKLLELIGDMLANAMHAITRKVHREEEAVELFMGFSKESGRYEIDIYDSGEPFPDKILSQFGRRGLTTGGTGEGLANMLEILEKYRIHLTITEYPDDEDMSKCLNFCFGESFAVSYQGERRGQFHLYCEK